MICIPVWRGCIIVSLIHGMVFLPSFYYRISSTLIKMIPASGTGEALLVVGVPKGAHNLPLHEEAARGAPLAELFLVAGGAVVVGCPGEKTPLGQGLAAACEGARVITGRRGIFFFFFFWFFFFFFFLLFIYLFFFFWGSVCLYHSYRLLYIVSLRVNIFILL